MPKKEFEAFTRLDASDVNTFLMDQSVMTFGSATARDAAIDTPVEGQVTYLTDIDSLTVYNGTQWVTNRPVMTFAGTAARGSAIPSPVEGMYTHLEDTDRLQFWNGSAWTTPFGADLLEAQTFTAQTSVQISDVFSSTYTTYKMFIRAIPASGNPGLNYKFRTAVGDDSRALYTNQTLAGDGTSVSGSRLTTQTQAFIGQLGSQGLSGFETTIYNPNLAEISTLDSKTSGSPSLAFLRLDTSTFNATTQFTGISIIAASSTITGSVRIYGLRD